MIQFSCDGLCRVLRFVGQTEWYCPDKRGKFNWDFLNHRDTQLEEVNMNYTLINYTGLVNLGKELCFFYSNFIFSLS